jgi:nucleoside-diphosphate kinase
MERTFAIIKPDAVAAGHSGEIIAIIEKAGFRVVGMKMKRLSQQEAEAFYAVHRERLFYAGLVKFMTEGPVVVMALEAPDAIKKWRDTMGATNPANAAEGTIRKRFATSIERNCVHGSDAPETAALEIPFFFSASELL